MATSRDWQAENNLLYMGHAMASVAEQRLLLLSTPRPPVYPPVPPRVDPAPVQRRPRKARRWLRTREVERLRVHNLQLDIHALQSDIRALQVARSLLQARALNRRDDRDGSYVKLMREYFVLLRHGYSYDHQGIETYQENQPRAFLHALMDQKVRKGRLQGVDQFIAMLARYTEAFGPVEHAFITADAHVAATQAVRGSFDCEPAAISQDVVVRVRSRFRTSIVEATFNIIFPQAPPALRRKLLGQELHGEGEFEIVFDSQTHRVRRFDMNFGFVQAFARVLPDPRDLAQLFDGALVTSDCCIGDLSTFTLIDDDDDHGQQARNPRPPVVVAVDQPRSKDATAAVAAAMDIRAILNEEDA